MLCEALRIAESSSLRSTSGPSHTGPDGRPDLSLQGRGVAAGDVRLCYRALYYKGDAGIESEELAIALARIAAENRCRDIAVLNLRDISQVTDFFVIATGTSGRQMKTVVAKMNDFLRGHPDVVPLGREGLSSERWVLLDLVDVIVHVFAPEARSFYALELLWGDAPQVDWQSRGRAPPPATRRGRARKR